MDASPRKGKVGVGGPSGANGIEVPKVEDTIFTGKPEGPR